MRLLKTYFFYCLAFEYEILRKMRIYHFQIAIKIISLKFIRDGFRSEAGQRGQIENIWVYWPLRWKWKLLQAGPVVFSVFFFGRGMGHINGEWSSQ